MKTDKSAKEAAKKSGNPPYDLTPLLPGNDNIGPLKDMAQEITAASAGLEGKVAPDTAAALGDQLRLVNSYYSNLIEGHKTTIPDIEMALRKEFNRDPGKKYAQELCAAHVETEKQFMQLVDTSQKLNVCDQQLLSDIHAALKIGQWISER